MTKPGKTEIVFVIDRSGSMQRIARDMEGGFWRFIEEQRAIPGECTVTLAQFDTEYEILYAARPLDDVGPYRLVPRGGTALLDAIGRTCADVGHRLAATPEHERPSRVIVVIITDGEENRSCIYSRAQVFEKIKHQRDVYRWDFVFLGTSQEAIAEAEAVGIRSHAQWQHTGAGGQALYGAVSNAVGAVRSSAGVQSMDLNQATYDAALANVVTTTHTPSGGK